MQKVQWVMNKITPADISNPQELIARAKALSVELATPITPGFDSARDGRIRPPRTWHPTRE
jgi:hypothetical protein